DALRLPVGDELRLQLEPLRIGQPAEPPHNQREGGHQHRGWSARREDLLTARVRFTRARAGCHRGVLPRTRISGPTRRLRGGPRLNQSADSSNSWRPFLIWAMNRSASEPSPPPAAKASLPPSPDLFRASRNLVEDAGARTLNLERRLIELLEALLDVGHEPVGVRAVPAARSEGFPAAEPGLVPGEAESD